MRDDSGQRYLRATNCDMLTWPCPLNPDSLGAESRTDHLTEPCSFRDLSVALTVAASIAAIMVLRLGLSGRHQLEDTTLVPMYEQLLWRAGAAE